MMFFETVSDKGKVPVPGNEGKIMRTHQWSMNMFKDCGFKVEMDIFTQYWGEDYFSDYLYCISPVLFNPEDYKVLIP